MKYEDLSETQQKVLRLLKRPDTYAGRQIAGKGRAHLLMAANALQRKGLAHSSITGIFSLTKEGLAVLESKQ